MSRKIADLQKLAANGRLFDFDIYRPSAVYCLNKYLKLERMDLGQSDRDSFMMKYKNYIIFHSRVYFIIRFACFSYSIVKLPFLSYFIISYWLLDLIHVLYLIIYLACFDIISWLRNGAVCVFIPHSCIILVTNSSVLINYYNPYISFAERCQIL